MLKESAIWPNFADQEHEARVNKNFYYIRSHYNFLKDANLSACTVSVRRRNGQKDTIALPLVESPVRDHIIFPFFIDLPGNLKAGVFQVPESGNVSGFGRIYWVEFQANDDPRVETYQMIHDSTIREFFCIMNSEANFEQRKTEYFESLTLDDKFSQTVAAIAVLGVIDDISIRESDNRFAMYMGLIRKKNKSQ